MIFPGISRITLIFSILLGFLYSESITTHYVRVREIVISEPNCIGREPFNVKKL